MKRLDLMKKYYIFSEMCGSYSYTIIIVEAPSLKEAILKEEALSSAKIKGYNYEPKLDPNRNVTIAFDKQHLFSKEELAIIDIWDETKIKFIVNNYERIMNNCHYGKNQGISCENFIRTNEEGWFDWINVYGYLPENYKFIDGHDG